MQALIDNGRYKVTEVLYSDEGFDVCLCTDVMVNTGKTVVISTYKDKRYIHELLPVFYEVKNNGMIDFEGLITADGSVSAVFEYHKGISFSEYYPLKKGKKRVARNFGECMEIAEKLLLRTLELDLADDRIAFCVLDEHNIIIDINTKSVGFNIRILPNTVPEPSFKGRRLGGLLERMFPKNRYLPIEIERFITELHAGKYPTCTSIYSHWREISEQAQKTRAEYEKESIFQYLSRIIKRKKQEKAVRGQRSG